MSITSLRKPRVEMDGDRIVRAFVPSSSKPGVEYEMVRSLRGRWQHIDVGCEAWKFGSGCFHIEALKRLEEERAT